MSEKQIGTWDLAKGNRKSWEQIIILTNRTQREKGRNIGWSITGPILTCHSMIHCSKWFTFKMSLPQSRVCGTDVFRLKHSQTNSFFSRVHFHSVFRKLMLSF